MVKIKGNVYDTVEIPRPSPPYVTLEILSKDKNICKGRDHLTFILLLNMNLFFKNVAKTIVFLT